MNETLTDYEDEHDWDESACSEPRAIGEVLEELFAQYQTRFPEVNIAVIEVPAAA